MYINNKGNDEVAIMILAAASGLIGISQSQISLYIYH